MPALVSVAAVPLGLVLATAIFLRFHRRSLQAPGRKGTEIYLVKSPNEFATLDIVYLVISLLTKYLFSALGLTAALQPARSAPQAFALPRIQVQGLLNITETDVRRFRVALRDTSAPSPRHQANVLLLPALTGPLVIYLLSLPACPIKPLGAVNTRNRITSFSKTTQDSDSLILASKSNRLSYTATFGAAHGRRAKRGIEFEIQIDVFLESAQGSGRERIMTQELGFLQFLPKTALPHFAGQVEQRPQTDGVADESLPSQQLKIGKDAPLKWAACNKDLNPIHVSTVGAKLFGQKSVIAHGMHTVALALQSVRDDDSEVKGMGIAKSVCWNSTDAWKSWTLDMHFLRPVTLPAMVSLRAAPARTAEQAELGIVKDGKVLTWIRCEIDM